MHVPAKAPAAITRTKARWTMLVPIGLLALGAVVRRPAVPRRLRRAEGAPEFWRGSVAFSEHLAHAMHEVPAVGEADRRSIVMLIGLCDRLAQLYPRARRAGGASSRMFPACYRFLCNKWYFDELYDLLFVRPALWLGRLFWQRRRRGHDRPLRPARRGLCGRRRQPAHRAAPVGLSLFLCAGDAARPDRRGDLGVLVG